MGAMTYRRALALLALVAGLFVVAAPAPASSTPAQIITVQASSSSATSAVLNTWTRLPSGGYQHLLGPISAWVGYNGVGHANESSSTTPAGVFTLTQAFGNAPNNGSGLPYFQAGPRDWWDENPASPQYNRHVVQTASPGGNSENLYDSGVAYSHAVVINYNTNPVVPGAGSGMFLHVSLGKPTQGCVSINPSSLNSIMQWLTPSAHPVISIGVGAAATAIVTSANARAAHNPVGRVDGVTVAAGTVHAGGWAYDPDATSAALTVALYVDVSVVATSRTGVRRPDVAKSRHVGPNQGFSFGARIGPGRHRVCVHVANVGVGLANPTLGCVVVSVPAA